MSQIVPVKTGNFLLLAKGNARTLYQITNINQPCYYCRGNDAVHLNIPANNDEGLNITENEYTLINNKVGYKMTVCLQVLYDEVRKANPQDFLMYPESKNEDIQKRLLEDNA